ncbi:MAG: hypothetical protein M3256_02440 [Actinomycetota bacterium]|nr:hypothetical protein [Actinomycetota bacterium]
MLDVLRRHDVRAAVVDSDRATYDVEPIAAPILLRGGTANRSVPDRDQQLTE